MNEVLDSIKQNEGEVSDNESTTKKKTVYSKLSFSDSVDEETVKEPDDSEFDDTFEEEVISSSIRRRRRAGRVKIR